MRISSFRGTAESKTRAGERREANTAKARSPEEHTSYNRLDDQWGFPASEPRMNRAARLAPAGIQRLGFSMTTPLVPGPAFPNGCSRVFHGKSWARRMCDIELLRVSVFT